jgi:hypothetical protein
MAEEFFYMKNTTDVDLLNLPPYVDEPPNRMKNWTYNPKNTVGLVNALHRVKGELRDAGLTPQDIVGSRLPTFPCLICSIADISLVFD